MEQHAEPNLFQLVLEGGPLSLFVVLFSVGCALWLLVTRIQGCFRPRLATPGRDLAFLITGPVCAVLLSAIKAIVAAQSFVRGGMDSEFPLIYGLSSATAICVIALLCFAVGVIAFMLPTKNNANVAYALGSLAVLPCVFQ